MTTRLPAISLAAVPGRRKATLELAQDIERRGFPGIYCPSFGDGIGLCEAIALSTREIRFGTSITPIYTRNVQDFAQTDRVHSRNLRTAASSSASASATRRR